MTRALLISAVLSVVGVALALLWFGDGETVQMAVRALSAVLELPLWVIALVLALTFGNALCGALRLFVLARGAAVSLSLRRALRAYLLGRFGDMITPGGSGQMPVLSLALVSDGLSAPKAWSVTLYTTLLDLFFFGSAVPVALWVLSQGAGVSLRSRLLPVLTLSLLFLGLWYLLAYQLARVGPLLAWLFRHSLLRRWRPQVLRFFDRLLDAMGRVKHRGFAVQVLLITLTAAMNLCNYAVFYAVATALGASLPMLATFAAVLLASVASFVVPTPGGSGFAEFFTVVLLRTCIETLEKEKSGKAEV